MLRKFFLPVCVALSSCSPKQPVTTDYPDSMRLIMQGIQEEIVKAKEKNGPVLNLCVLFRTSANPLTKTSYALIFQISKEGAVWIPPRYSPLELVGARGMGLAELTPEETKKITAGIPLLRCSAVGLILGSPGKSV